MGRAITKHRRCVMNSRIFTNPNELSVSKATGRLHEVFMRLEGRCINYDDLQLIIDQPSFADQVADLFRRRGVYLSAEDAAARAIMGPLGVFGPQEWEYFFGVKQSRRDLERATVVGFCSDVLRACANTHLLCWFPNLMHDEPLTIAYINKKQSDFCIRLLHVYGGGPFVSAQVCRSGWHLIRNEALPLPDDRNFSVYGGRGCYLPLAIEELLKIIFYYHLMGGPLQNYHAPVYLNHSRSVATRAEEEDIFNERDHMPVVGWHDADKTYYIGEEPLVRLYDHPEFFGVSEDFRPHHSPSDVLRALALTN